MTLIVCDMAKLYRMNYGHVTVVCVT